MVRNIVTFAKKNIRMFLFVGDILSLLVAFVAASYLKFDAPVLFDGWFERNMYYILMADISITALMFMVFKIYRIMWQFVVISDYIKLAKAFLISKVITCGCFFYIWTGFFYPVKYTRSFFTWMFIYSLLSIGCMIVSRMAVFAFYRKWKKSAHFHIIEKI